MHERLVVDFLTFESVDNFRPLQPFFESDLLPRGRPLLGFVGAGVPAVLAAAAQFVVRYIVRYAEDVGQIPIRFLARKVPFSTVDVPMNGTAAASVAAGTSRGDHNVIFHTGRLIFHDVFDSTQ
jgi:hypothetical protein